MLDTNRFEEFISQYPIYEYRVLDAAEIQVRERVRTICKQECERYGTTWACPPAVGLRNAPPGSTATRAASFFPAWQRFPTL